MTRSLYVRIVATFLLVVVLSIGLAFLLANQMFKQSRGSLQQNYGDAFERIRQLHNVAEPSSLPRFLEEIADIEEMSILAINTKGERISVGEQAEELRKRVEGLRSSRPSRPSPEGGSMSGGGALPELLTDDVKDNAVSDLNEGRAAEEANESDSNGSEEDGSTGAADVQGGDSETAIAESETDVQTEASGTARAESMADRPWGFRPLLPPHAPSLGESIGRLVTLDGEQWSLFLQHNRYPRNSNFIVTASTLLLTLLLIGSILILFAARFLVRPIKTINDAALRMSGGNFSVRLPVKRRDELGILAHSMNTMADGLSRIETMRQDFVANVSHEIQSPLTSIHGFAEALRSVDVTEEERKRYVGIIQQESSRLSKLSENLLKLSALDAEQHPYRPLPYRLDRQLREATLACEPAWRGKPLRVELYAEELSLVGDAELLNVVWTNLLTNSIKFTPAGGSIAIGAAAVDEYISVTVQDTGPGIPPEARERIFERFYKADPSRDRNIGGSGLGLAIARKIVELHGGTIELRQEQTADVHNSDQGACFVVRLPRAATP
jgi:signal transduction histidine kinase